MNLYRAIGWLLAFVFGCHHSLSRVFTIRGRTYQVCCDCGAEFDYSWEHMSTGARIARSHGLLRPSIVGRSRLQSVGLAAHTAVES